MTKNRLFLVSTALSAVYFAVSPAGAQSVSAPDQAAEDAATDGGTIIVTGGRGAPRTVA